MCYGYGLADTEAKEREAIHYLARLNLSLGNTLRVMEDDFNKFNHMKNVNHANPIDQVKSRLCRPHSPSHIALVQA